MQYSKPPNEISYQKIIENQYILAPSSLHTFNITNSNTYPLRSLLSHKKKGIEIGSLAYISKSKKQYIRTKALNKNSFLLCKKGTETIIPMNPKNFTSFDFKTGDILVSKDSNIGECIIFENDSYKEDYMISGGIYHLRILDHGYYIFGIMKSDFYKQQILASMPRGSTLKHAKELFLDCKIPFPCGPDADSVITKVETIVKNIINNESRIQQLDAEIRTIIDNELKNNQKNTRYTYEYPSLDEVKNSYRLDTGIYSEDYKVKQFLVKNYTQGYNTLIQLGFKTLRGSSLEIKGLGTRLNSEVYKKELCALIIPTNISEYGTIEEISYIGTKKDLKIIKRGDIIFGGEGFEKGRSFVVCDSNEKVATNYHGIRIFKDKTDLTESIVVRCFLSYWKYEEMIDHIGVGGSGGHLAPEYFNYLLIPNFRDPTKELISNKYFNGKNGIYDLDKTNLKLRNELYLIINKISDGKL